MLPLLQNIIIETLARGCGGALTLFCGWLLNVSIASLRTGNAKGNDHLTELQRLFRTPDDSRIMMRWWWLARRSPKRSSSERCVDESGEES